MQPDRKQAAWQHQNPDFDTANLDAYPYAEIIAEFNELSDVLDRTCTALIVFAVICLVLVVVIL